ncbi:hypothetical protein OM304_17255 [Escherichia albertii]|nr:hypothetical protein [Escherichia albertii]MCZ9197120.1 hypothetical protein [Escherichia albertii]MCZ9216080.1 hypothetical protein [Escherichia albertii]MCZ9225137.1 hypothetical protein [Escherichia albertii]
MSVSPLWSKPADESAGLSSGIGDRENGGCFEITGPDLLIIVLLEGGDKIQRLIRCASLCA